MKNHHPGQDPIPAQLKRLIVDLFRLDISEPEAIADDAPLIGGSLGLDSLDALELAICLEEKFGVTIQSREESLRAFASIASLTRYIVSRTQAVPFGPSSPVLPELPVGLALGWEEKYPEPVR